jgi:DNA-binding CsgD family transcriptional regulator
VLDVQGRIAWRSPQATRWLAQAFAAPDADDGTAMRWLAGVPAGGEDAVPLPDGSRLLARHLGPSWLAETMLLLAVLPPGVPSTSRMPTTALTPREAEVLSWLAKGKTNRDIADILGMSPRTVNKHLEHIYEKLGVETRTAAVAVAGQLQVPG